jgi:hypothetical protein
MSPSIIFLNGPMCNVKHQLTAELRKRFTENACVTINRKVFLNMLMGNVDNNSSDQAFQGADESHEWIVLKVVKNILNNGAFVIFDAFLPSRRVKQYVEAMHGLPCYWIGIFFQDKFKDLEGDSDSQTWRHDNEFYDFTVKVIGENEDKNEFKNATEENTEENEMIENAVTFDGLSIDEAVDAIYKFVENGSPKCFQATREVEKVARKRMRNYEDNNNERPRFKRDSYERDKTFIDAECTQDVGDKIDKRDDQRKRDEPTNEKQQTHADGESATVEKRRFNKSFSGGRGRFDGSERRSYNNNSFDRRDRRSSFQSEGSEGTPNNSFDREQRRDRRSSFQSEGSERTKSQSFRRSFSEKRDFVKKPSLGTDAPNEMSTDTAEKGDFRKDSFRGRNSFRGRDTFRRSPSTGERTGYRKYTDRKPFQSDAPKQEDSATAPTEAGARNDFRRNDDRGPRKYNTFRSANDAKGGFRRNDDRPRSPFRRDSPVGERRSSYRGEATSFRGNSSTGEGFKKFGSKPRTFKPRE